MGLSRFNSKLLYKYVVTYVVILLLPVMMVGFFVYQYFIQLLEDEVTRSNLNLLSQVKENVDVKMTELHNIAFHISGNTRLTPYQVTKNPFTELDTISQLRNYVSANTFISNFLLYFHGHHKVYSPYSTYDAAEFTDKIYTFENWEPEQFYRDINEATIPYVRKSEDVRTAVGGRERYITYVMPIGPNPSDSFGTVIYLINENRFKELIKKKFEDAWSNTLILDEKGELITSSQSMDPGKTEILLERLQANSEGQGTLNVEEREYFVFQDESAKFGWTYITLVDKDTVMLKVEQAKSRTFYGLLLLVLVGSILIFFATHMNYKPIRMLKRLADSKVNIPPGSRLGEIESIRSALDVMSENNDELNRKIERSRPALKYYLILNLLKGEYKSKDDLRGKGELAGLRLESVFYTVMVLLFPKNHGHLSVAGLPDGWCEALPQGTEVFGIEGLEAEQLVLVMGTNEAVETMEMLLKMTHETLSRSLGMDVTIGVGNSYVKLEELGKSYIEACGALNYRLIKGKGSLIFFREAVSEAETNRNGYSKSQWNRLKQFIYQSDTSGIEAFLRQLIDRIRKEQLPLFMVKCICFDLINVILAILEDMELDEKALAERYPDVVKLTEFETVDDLIELVKDISTDIRRILSERKESGNREPVEKMKLYIGEHFGSTQFSVQNLADELGMSASYLSRYFKEQTGFTISHYVNRLRMEKAKELLKHGEGNLQEVVDRIGYGSVSGFIRKFKEQEGMTPGDYRTLKHK